MEFLGAADYYFWQGVKKGLGRSINLVDEEVAQLYVFGHNEVSWSCYEAFGWGYCFGTELTQDEYNELTSIITPDKVEEVKEIVELNLEEKINTQIQGNC